MADRSVALFTAVHAALAADTALLALIGTDAAFSPALPKVYDHVPPGVALPYVVIGDETAIDASGSEVDAQEHTVTVHVWSERQSSLQAKQIAGAVRDALHGQSLTLAAGRCPNIRCEFKETMRDPDGITWHAVLRFRAVSQD